jgi:hypothetical protein
MQLKGRISRGLLVCLIISIIIRGWGRTDNGDGIKRDKGRETEASCPVVSLRGISMGAKQEAE